MLRLFKNTTTGTTYAIGETVIGGVTASQLQDMLAAGYTVTNLTSTQLATVVKLHGFDPINLPGADVVDKIDSIPLTVQGASEDFITSTTQQVLVSFGQQTNTINGNVVIMRDQVKAHVTSEADRVIASV